MTKGPARGVVASARAQARKTVLAAHGPELEAEVARLLAEQGFVAETVTRWVTNVQA